MILKEVKVIEIEWEGPFHMDEIRQMNGDTDFGLYMAYGHHRVYGENVLLYVGKAEKQTFSKRIMDHFLKEDWYGTESIYLGRLGGKSDDEISFSEWEEYIDYAESKFIQYCQPAWNSSKLGGNKKPTFGEAIIFNNGKQLFSIPRVLSDVMFLKSSFHHRCWVAYSNKRAKNA